MLKSFKKFSRKVTNNERGQGMVEYILLLVVVVALVFMFKGKIMSAVNGKVEELGGKIEGFSGDQ